MFVLLVVALAWDAVHKADIPDTAPHFRVQGHSIIKNPEPSPEKWAFSPASGAMDEATHRHAQRGDAGTQP